MPSAEIAVMQDGTFTALTKSITDLRAIIADNLGGDEISEFDLPRVGIPPGGGGRWTVPGAFGEESEPELSGVLMFAKRTRAYWPNPDPTGEPPQCRSLDARIGVGDPGGDCKLCPMAQFGSSQKGEGSAQACSEKAIWFLLREGSILPIVLALPATSLRGEKSFRVGLVSNGIKLTDVVTTVALRKEQGPSGAYGIAVPRVTARLSAEEAAKARSYAQELLPILERAAAADITQPATSAPTVAAVPDADVA